MTAATTKPIKKMAAVKKALKVLGKDAMPVKIQEFIKEKFGLEMSAAYVSTYKSHILLARKAKRLAAKTKNDGGLTLNDIETVKGLVSRMGEENLKSLVGVLGSI